MSRRRSRARSSRGAGRWPASAAGTGRQTRQTGPPAATTLNIHRDTRNIQNAYTPASPGIPARILSDGALLDWKTGQLATAHCRAMFC